uniref:Uncharacterized protein n=1 Tax=Anopheles coluzzii TaxID=1518534 RepID=A0A8W7PHD2_ANOCL
MPDSVDVAVAAVASGVQQPSSSRQPIATLNASPSARPILDAFMHTLELQTSAMRVDRGCYVVARRRRLLLLRQMVMVEMVLVGQWVLGRGRMLLVLLAAAEY